MNVSTAARRRPAAESEEERFVKALARYASEPVSFCSSVLGMTLEPWACDVLDAYMTAPSVAIRSCHGVGKTAILAAMVSHFTATRLNPRVPTTAPTFNKQVRDILWGEIHKWWRNVETRWPWLYNQFDLLTTRLQNKDRPANWFAVGIASSKAINMEGYHADNVLIVFDEAKGIPKAAWEAVYGARTTAHAILVAASTPGAPLGEFFKVFDRLRTTWRHTFVIHPEPLRAEIKTPEVMGTDPETGARVRGRFSEFGGTYFSARPTKAWVDLCREEWGADSAVFIARVKGDFPTVIGDNLYPFPWLSFAEDQEAGSPGRRVVACDVARYGRDRTVFLVLEGGTVIHGETAAKNPAESTTPETESVGVGDDPRRPAHRAINVTADICRRLRMQFNADTIVVDDTGLAGLADFLKLKGESVVPINFGASPTDKPSTPEERAWRERRHLIDYRFVNIKAEMAWTLRNAFEVGRIALGNLPRAILEPLMGQLALVKGDMDVHGRQRVVDPDEQDDLAAAAGAIEGRKSPDHFHALILGWWVAGGFHRGLIPRFGPAVPPGITTIGEPTTQIGRIMAGPGQGGQLGGQAAGVERWYRRP